MQADVIIERSKNEEEKCVITNHINERSSSDVEDNFDGDND
jgi:hypothetical protein